MAHSGWRVTQQVTDQIVPTAGGNVLTGVQVYYITGKGNEGSVFVPNQQYNEATVRSMVDASAHVLDSVGTLAAGPAE